MNYKQEIERIKKQLENTSQALDDLSSKMEDHSSNPDPTSDININKIVSYLALGSNIEDNSILTMVLQSAMHVVGAGGAGLTILDQEGKNLVFKAAIGDGAEGILGYSVPLQGSQHGLAFATGEVQSSTPVNNDIEYIAKTQFRNVLVAPLFISEDKIGTISAVNKRNGEHFTAEDMEAYRHFAELAALIVRQHQRETILKNLIACNSGIPAEPIDIQFSNENRQLMTIIQNLLAISEKQPDLLSVCMTITELLANTAASNDWSL